MSLTRRSFVKKSSYSVAAVSILGMGTALAEGASSGLVHVGDTYYYYSVAINVTSEGEDELFGDVNTQFATAEAMVASDPNPVPVYEGGIESDFEVDSTYVLESPGGDLSHTLEDLGGGMWRRITTTTGQYMRVTYYFKRRIGTTRSGF